MNNKIINNKNMMIKILVFYKSNNKTIYKLDNNIKIKRIFDIQDYIILHLILGFYYKYNLLNNSKYF